MHIKASISVVAVLVMGLLAPVAKAADARLEECIRFEWDYPPTAGLGFFRLYVTQTSGSYLFGEAYPKLGGYVSQIPSIQEMLTSVPCAEIHLSTSGTYYAVVTAVSRDLKEESGPSNEVSFTYGNMTSVPPPNAPTRPPGRPAPAPTLPPVPPPLTPPRPPPVARGPGSGSGGLIGDTCMWTGTCQ